MHFSTPIILSVAGMAFASPPECPRNNCLRAVAGTRIPGQTLIASADCSRILASATIPATVTIYSNFTVTRTINNKLKRAITPPAGIPTYAVGCDDLAEYSSACSCFGITGSVATSGTTTITVTKTATATIRASGTSGLTNPPVSSTRSGTPTPTPSPSSNSVRSGTPTTTISSTSIRSNSTSSGTPTSSIPPTCTASVKIDPLNCGTCGNICSSGVCSNGVCSSEACNAQICGGFTNCNPNNTECFCFSTVEQTIDPDTGSSQNIGFCGQNAQCGALTACKASADCNVPGSTGNVCAINTCCGEAGVCLIGQCGNPARKLIRMALAGSARFRGTAAY